LKANMRKTDKKLDNTIRAELTEICEYALSHTQGFLWLTHTVDYQRFPSSLEVRCVFTPESLQAAIQDRPLNSLITSKLKNVDITIQSEKIRYTLEVIQ
jgi:hypothetical protein